MGRIPRVERNELDDDFHHAIEIPSIRPDGSLHVLQVLANNPSLLVARREYSAALRGETGLTERQRELVILTVAAELCSEYEWHQHVKLAGENLLSRAEVRAISAGKDGEFASEDAALIAYVRRFVDTDVDDGVHEELAEFFDDSEIVGIGMLAGGYIGLAHALDAFDVEIEEDEFVGWEP